MNIKESHQQLEATRHRIWLHSQYLRIYEDQAALMTCAAPEMAERTRARIRQTRALVAAIDRLAEEPEDVYDLVGAIADKKIEFIKKAAKYYQPDYFTYLDDYSHKTGLFMSKNTFREIFKPHLKRIVEAVNETDMNFKMHCCGKMEDLFDDFLDLGITAFDPVQCVNNIPEMKKKTLKKAGLMGGLDVQGLVDMGEVSEDALRKEVRRCIDTYAEGGGYMIYGASIHMFNPAAYAPTGPLGIIIDECAKYGKNYYQK